jgi:3-phenylpropionate/trans-cinnamate dioxygenase ferredoxin reductase component
MSGGMAAANGIFDGRIVIVGASLAGLRAAEALRLEGFTGSLTLIGDEPYPPYDRPPLSKTVLSGRLPVEHTTLPWFVDVDAEWRLGVPATGLDLVGRRVHLADAQEVEFDRLLITTGTRAAVAKRGRGHHRWGLHRPYSRRCRAAARAAGGRAGPGPHHRRRLHRFGSRLRLP